MSMKERFEAYAIETSRSRKSLDIPGIGTVYWKPMTTERSVELHRAATVLGPDGQEKLDPAKLNIMVWCLCLEDENGAPIFSAQDAEWIKHHLPVSLVAKVALAVVQAEMPTLDDQKNF